MAMVSKARFSGKRNVLRIAVLLSVMFGFAVRCEAQYPSQRGPRLAAPLPTPPINLPPLQLGTPGPRPSAPVMAAPPQPVQVFRNESALQYTAPQLAPQSTIYLAEPQPVSSTESTTKTAPKAMPTTPDPSSITQRWPGLTGGQRLFGRTDSAESAPPGKAAVGNMRKAVDFSMGVDRCPDCGKRRPEYNRIRIGMIRLRNFIITGEGEVKVAASPNANRAS